MKHIVKKLASILFILTMIFVIDFNTQIYAESDGVIYLSAAEYGYPPFSMENNGEADGFSIQLLKEVAMEMGIQIEFKMDYWLIIKEELIDGDLDVLPLVGFTQERDEVLDFTVPYIVMRGNIFVRDGDSQIQSVDDLYGKEVLVLSGDNSEEYARSIGLDEELTATATYGEAFQLLSSGNYDAVLAQGLVGEKIIADEGITNVSPVYVFDDEGISKIKLNLEGYEQKFCFAVVEGDDELLSILNEGLSIVSANGTYDRLYQEWFPFLIDQSRSFEDIMGIILAVIIPLIIVLLGASLLIIKRQVKNQTTKIVKISLSSQVILEAFEKKFESDKERYTYFLEEALRLSESSDGIMFTVNCLNKVKINAHSFGKIKTICSIEEMENAIERVLAKHMKRFEPFQFIFNEFNFNKQFPSMKVKCLDDVVHAAILSFKTESKEMFYTLIANKIDLYNEDDLTQISILISGFVTMIDRSNYIKQVEFLSYHDSLTGLYNRRYVEKKMEEFKDKNDHPISVIFADVNRLKEVNDTYGHVHGDALLKKTGELIKMHSHPTDVVARWGGDEFVIIKTQSSNTDAETFIKKITHSAQKTDFGISSISIAFGFSHKYDVTASLGLCLIDAEKMMYKNKLIMNQRFE